MEREKLTIWLDATRSVEILDLRIKIYEDKDDYIKGNDNYRYLTEAEYNSFIADNEVKLYLLLSIGNIQNPEVLTPAEVTIIENFKNAYGSVMDQYQSFDSDIAVLNEVLELIFASCKYISIW